MARSPSPAITGAALGLFALGFTAAAWSGTLHETVGAAADTVLAFGAVAALALALGTRIAARPGRARHPLRLAGTRLVTIASITLAAPLLAARMPTAIGWAGGAADAHFLAVAAARLLVGAVVLGPSCVLAGSALRLAVLALPEGPSLRVAFATGVAAAAAGALAATALPLSTPAASTAAAVLLLLVGVAGVRAGRGASRAAPPDRAPSTGHAAVPAAAAALATAALAFLGSRALLPAFGNELPGVPVAAAVFLAGLALGAGLARPALRIAWAPQGVGVALLTGAITLPLLVQARLGALPARFAEAAAQAATLADVVRAGVGFALPVVLPAAITAGFACAVVGARAPEDSGARASWLARTLLGGALGALLGLALRLSLDALGLARFLTLAALLIAALGAAVLAREAPRSRWRAAVAVLAFAVVAFAAARTPRLDRSGWLVEQALRSEASPIEGVQKSWRILDEDAAAGTWSVLKRGHEKRLFVNGRFEMGTVSQLQGHGLLAHLPLILHPAPRRVAVLGAGNGFAVHSALSHPIERLLVLAPARAAVHAAERFGTRGAQPFADERVRLATGDPVDLLARCGPQDVILNQVSGSWTELSARTSTREFLELVRRRLGQEGMYCHWLPGSALTKPGFQTLLATLAAVFPRVEVWAGQGGDVLLLATPGRAPHDFAAVRDAYGIPALAASLESAWVADAPTLFSQFLVPDEVVRGISRTSPVHSRHDPQLAAVEAARRRTEPTVNPVPGLAEIRGDVLRGFANLPGGGFETAVARAVQARDLERRAVLAEIDARGSLERRMEVANLYDQALALNPHDGSIRRAAATLRTVLGIDYSNGGSFTAAYSNMLRAVEADTTFAEGFANLGMLLMDNQDFDYALVVTRQAIDLAPDDDLLYHQMARIWKRRTYYDKAVPYYHQAMEINPRNVEAAMGLSDTMLSMETVPDIEAAIAFLEDYLAVEPDNEELLYRLDKLRRALERGDIRPPAEGEGEDATPPLMREVEEDTTLARSTPARGGA